MGWLSSQCISSPYRGEVDTLAISPMLTLSFAARNQGGIEVYTFIDPFHDIVFLAAPVRFHEHCFGMYPLMARGKGRLKLLFTE